MEDRGRPWQTRPRQIKPIMADDAADAADADDADDAEKSGQNWLKVVGSDLFIQEVLVLSGP